MCSMKSLSLCYASPMLVIVLALLLSACHQVPPSADPAFSSHATTVKSENITNHIPRSSTSIPKQSFSVLIQALPMEQRIRVREWYRRIGGPPMDGSTPAQVAWMQAQHYPMPADIVRAASMNDKELKAAANAGDTTAEILYTGRLLDEYSRRFASATASPAPVSWHGPERSRLVNEINLKLPQILASGSPFAGYLYAAKDRLMNPGDVESNAAALLAGTVWAIKFGDIRANRLLDDPTVQAVNAATATATMNLVLKDAMRHNPKVFSTPVIPIPSS